MVVSSIGLKNQLFLLFSLFLLPFSLGLLLFISLHFLVLFMDPTVLFQLPFSFIYSTFKKKKLVSSK